MPIFRVLRTLSRGFDTFIPKGELTRLHWLKPEQQQKLVSVGAVSQVSAPPLATLPGWKLRGTRLGKVGIQTFDDFLERDPAAIAEEIGAQKRTVENWRKELVGYITVPERPQGRRGR